MSISHKLHKILILLSALLIIFVYAGVVFHAHNLKQKWLLEYEIAPAFFVLQEPLSFEIPIPELSQAVPIIPLSWQNQIFFDPAKNKIYSPENIILQYTEHNQAYYLHQITLSGATFPHRNRLFMLYSPLIINIEQSGDTLNIRTRYGAK